MLLWHKEQHTLAVSCGVSLYCVSWPVVQMIQGGVVLGTVVSNVLVSWCPVVEEVFL